MKVRHGVFLLLVISLMVSGIIPAATITVVEGGCDLSDAIRSANADAPRGDCSSGSGADTISFQTGFVVDLTSNLPVITSTVTIESTIAGMATIDGDENYRGLDIDGADVTLNNIRIQNGYRGDFEDGGSAIRVRNGGSLILNNSLIMDNVIFGSSHGGAILVLDSDLEINDSQINNNFPDRNLPFVHYKTGGIYAENATVTIRRSGVMLNRGGEDDPEHLFTDSTLIIEESLFESNFFGAPGYPSPTRTMIGLQGTGSALFVNSTLATVSATVLRASGNNAVTFVNTTASSTGNPTVPGHFDGPIEIADSSLLHAANSAFDCGCYFDQGGALGTDDSNFYVDDSCSGAQSPGLLLLLPLDERGGPTKTKAPHWLSGAINDGTNGPCPAIDQRGEPRDALCDIGAYERSNQVDISVAVQMGSAAPYPLGAPLQLNVNLSNSNQNTANGIQLDMSFDNLSVTSISGLCTTNPCIVDTLLPTATQTVTVHAVPNNGGASDFGMTAQVSNAPNSIYEDTNPANDSDSLTEFLGISADLSIDKTLLTSPPYFVGQTIQYELVVENHGPNSAIDVVVSDQPTGLAILGITNCSPTPTSPCEFPVMSNGAVETMVVSAQISATTFDNAASVQSAIFDHFGGNNSDAKFNGGDTASEADLKVTLIETTPGLDYIDKPLVYALSIGNTGPDAATNVAVDVTPEGFFITGVSGACSVIPCQLSSIASGDFASLTINGFITTTGHGVVTAFAQADQTDPDIVNSTATDQFSSREAADVQLFLDLLSPPPFIAGQSLQYRLTVLNAPITPNYAHNVLVDMAPMGLHVTSAQSDSCLSLPCTIPTLGLGQSEVIDIMAFVPNPGPFELSATAHADQYDPFPSNNSDTTGNGGTAILDPEEVPFSDSWE